MAGKEPAVPDFREIMDMDYALSLYYKDVAEMRNNSRPQDLAAMLSRDKLKNLFPEIPADTLSELLHAHEENFQATVEVTEFSDLWFSEFSEFSLNRKFSEFSKSDMIV